MTSSGILISPLTTAIGAEVSGVDIGGQLDEATLDVLYRALIEHLVIFFRDQEISPERHLAFAQSFGELDEPHPVYAHVPGFERIVMLANDAKNPPDTDGWHTDLTFRPNPLLHPFWWRARCRRPGVIQSGQACMQPMMHCRTI